MQDSMVGLQLGFLNRQTLENLRFEAMLKHGKAYKHVYIIFLYMFLYTNYIHIVFNLLLYIQIQSHIIYNHIIWNPLHYVIILNKDNASNNRSRG